MHATMEGRKRKRGTAQPPDTKGLKRPHVEVDDGENDLAKHLRRVGFPPQVCQAFIGRRDSAVGISYYQHLVCRSQNEVRSLGTY